MTSRIFAEFKTDLPDDSTWSEQGDLIKPRGENVAAALQSALEQSGVKSSIVRQHKFYGWRFTAVIGSASYVVLVQFPDNNGIIEVQTRVSTYRWIQGTRIRVSEVAFTGVMDAIIRHDGRFQSSEWIHAASAGEADARFAAKRLRRQ